MSLPPHGGTLINRIADQSIKEGMLRFAQDGNMEVKSLTLNAWEQSDLEMIAIGAFSPLEGFMDKSAYDSVIRTGHLTNGLPWTLPIVLSTTPEIAQSLKEGSDVILKDESQHPLGILHLEEKYPYDKKEFAREIFLTEDENHPGVAVVYAQGDILLGGKITLLERRKPQHFLKYRLDPAETRCAFQEKKWKTVVGFQTRNPIHRAHEYLQKCAMEIVDGLLIHPIVGETKSDDISAEVRMRCYEVLMEHYYPKDRVMLAVNPANMRYAGPKEAIFHAIVRKNYGCTHFIVGRDHAGVGNYYGTYDAHYIFDNFDKEKLGITPLFFEHAFYCKMCGNMASVKTCPHGKEQHVFLSGTKVREMLRAKQLPPVEFTRPEVAKVLMEVK
jgi:sulfate adenylyltransferase